MEVMAIMKVRAIIIILTLILFLVSCVPKYRRSIEGFYSGSNSSALLGILDKLLKENRFIFKGTAEKPVEYTIVAFYSRYDNTLQQEITSVIFLKGVDKNDRSQFLVTVNGPGREEAIKREVDKAFEALVSEIESRLDSSKLKILKKS
jgi:hypothetical protein